MSEFSAFFGFWLCRSGRYSVTSVPIQEDYVNLEDAELLDPPYHSHDDVFSEEFSYADDPFLDCVSTGLEAEALIKKYGETFLHRWSSSPRQPRFPASFFRGSKPVNTGIELPPDFSREIDRISLIKDARPSAKAIANGFRFPKETSEKYFDTEKASPELMTL